MGTSPASPNTLFDLADGSAPSDEWRSVPMVVDENDFEDDFDLVLGTAVEQLLEDGDETAAVLLLDVRDMRWEYDDTLFPLSGDGEPFDRFDVVLIVDRYQIRRFTDDVMERVQSALSSAAHSSAQGDSLRMARGTDR